MPADAGNKPLIGPSPHAWGLLSGARIMEHVHRFIPTYVGFTKEGEYRRLAEYGSSPHTWGLHLRKTPYSFSRRFIPTYAGFTSGLAFGVDRGRFIPTCVGFTLRSGACPACTVVHPYIRGVYTKGKLNFRQIGHQISFIIRQKVQHSMDSRIIGSKAAFQGHKIFQDLCPPERLFETAFHR